MRFLWVIIPFSVTCAIQVQGAEQPGPLPPAKAIAAHHFRVADRVLLQANGALVHELTVETPEPADVYVTLFHRGMGAAPSVRTRCRPGQASAVARLVVLVDYLSGSGNERRLLRTGCLKVVVSELDEAGTGKH